jgi:hypothetical protein
MSAERKELEDMRRLNERVRDGVRKKARRNKQLANVRRALDSTVDYRRFGK